MRIDSGKSNRIRDRLFICAGGRCWLMSNVCFHLLLRFAVVVNFQFLHFNSVIFVAFVHFYFLFCFLSNRRSTFEVRNRTLVRSLRSSFTSLFVWISFFIFCCSIFSAFPGTVVYVLFTLMTTSIWHTSASSSSSSSSNSTSFQTDASFHIRLVLLLIANSMWLFLHEC